MTLRILIPSILSISLVLMSCGSEGGTTDSPRTDSPVQESSDSLDGSAHQDLQVSLDSLKRLRSNEFADMEGYKIQSSPVLSSEHLAVWNITERMGDRVVEYAVCFLKQGKEVPTSEQPDGILGDVQGQLSGLGVPFQLFEGHLSLTEDVLGDGSPDLLVSGSQGYRTTMTEYQELILFDGVDGLKKSGVVAYSDFEAGICEEFIGYREKILISGDNSKRVTVSREEHRSNSGDCENLTRLSYRKVYQLGAQGDVEHMWVDNSQWADSADFRSFPREFTNLTDSGNGYVVTENCQNGGPSWAVGISTYQITEGISQLIYNTSDDAIEVEFLAGFEQVDSVTYSMVLRPLSSMDFGDDFDAIESAGAMRVVSFRKEPAAADHWTFIWSAMTSLMTTDATLYPFVSCGE